MNLKNLPPEKVGRLAMVIKILTITVTSREAATRFIEIVSPLSHCLVLNPKSNYIEPNEKSQ